MSKKVDYLTGEPTTASWGTEVDEKNRPLGWDRTEITPGHANPVMHSDGYGGCLREMNVSLSYTSPDLERLEKMDVDQINDYLDGVLASLDSKDAVLYHPELDDAHVLEGRELHEYEFSEAIMKVEEAIKEKYPQNPPEIIVGMSDDVAAIYIKGSGNPIAFYNFNDGRTYVPKRNDDGFQTLRISDDGNIEIRKG